MRCSFVHLFALALATAVFSTWCSARTVDIGAPMQKLVEADWIAHLDHNRGSSVENNAKEVTTSQDAAGACDGIKNGKWGFHTASSEQNPWWQVDLGREIKLDRVVIFNRTDSGTASRTANIEVLISRDGSSFERVYKHDGQTFYGVKENRPLVVAFRDKNVSARVVRLRVPGRCSFALDEVEVYPAQSPEKNIALGKKADRKSVGPYSWPGTIGVTPEAEAQFTRSKVEDLIERGLQLAGRLVSEGADEARLGELTGQLRAIRGDGRQAWLQARSLVRQIAFCNKLLNFDRILFVKRHDAKGVFHMCDQYYGFNGIRGGGLFVLEDAFSEEPRLTNLLEDAVVQQGRLKGRKLDGGVILSPELSYDGKTILFAHSEGTGNNLEWTLESCYHIFKINSDGTNLVQLTDGPWNDFDPCFLPNGRIVFISERRGGYLRCGRHCPVYTMYSMAADGRDIVCLSFHETHEWHPSVDNDGMIVYTRWDYVDRDTNVAHHIWTCFPDGRDPRSFHGNYPVKRENRPWMEMSIRAIPDSHKYVATAAAHHGHAFGSLVMIDPRPEDDRAMSQLTRLTPEVPFPEAERHIRPIKDCMVYATAWPLSENDYLCAYDIDAKNHGIYWIDRFGNRELLYRDPDIPSLSPIPLRPRKKPPVIPAKTSQMAGLGHEKPRPATIGVVNVYNSDFEWPQGTKITALRIIQALPKTTPPPNMPRIGVANQTNARAVLGTVPVEADGSAYFEAPVGKAIYFQALDENGMAVQSMRSATYVHPGEQLTCQGCHEAKRHTAGPEGNLPLAMRREPSPIKPDVEGSNPFNYVRLVQPVLDRNCVSCHQREKALDLTGVIEGNNGWTRSYSNLAGEYGFYFHVSNGSINQGIHGGSRTTAGKFGAKAARLLDYTKPGHYGVNLSDEDLHRLVLWLDCNSEFFGSYENTQAQARGEIVMPTLD